MLLLQLEILISTAATTSVTAADTAATTGTDVAFVNAIVTVDTGAVVTYCCC